jgi:hypothetical protein
VTFLTARLLFEGHYLTETETLSMHRVPQQDLWTWYKQPAAFIPYVKLSIRTILSSTRDVSGTRNSERVLGINVRVNIVMLDADSAEHAAVK